MQCLWCIVKHEQRKPFLQCLYLYSRPSRSRGSSSVAEPAREPSPQRLARAGSLQHYVSRRSVSSNRFCWLIKKQRFVSFSWPHECEVPLRNLYTAANAHNVFTDQRKEREGTWKRKEKAWTEHQQNIGLRNQWRWKFTVT